MKILISIIDFIAFVIIVGIFYHLIDMDKKANALVVLADNGKVQNAVSIQAGEDKVSLDKVGEMASFKEGEKPSDISVMSKDEMDKKFGDVLKAEPLKAKKIILYLNGHNREFSDASKKEIPNIIKSIEERVPCNIDIIGHTDTTGSASENIKTSFKRASLVKELLREEGVDVSTFVVKGYGEEDLLIQTKNNVKELRNRNVEIFIK